MRSLVDVNVLLPLVLENHPHRAKALAWWDACRDDSVLLTLPARMAVLRLLTNRKLMGSGVLTPDSAWQALSGLMEDVRTVVLHEVPPGVDALWQAFVRGREPSPNLWTDAWLAAHAEAGGDEMVTFDRGFRSFPLTHLRLLSAE